MTISLDTVFGRKCGTAAVPAALAMAVALGVCDRAAGQDVSEKGGEPTGSSADVTPDWQIVEDYLERQKAWTEQVRRKVLAGVPDDLPSSGVGEKASSPRSRIVVIPASGDGLPSQAEMVEALREATEGRNSDGSLDAQLPDEGSRALVDELLRAAAGGQGDVKVVNLRSTDGESSSGAGETAADGRDRQGQAALDGAAPGQSEPPDIGRAAAAAVAILEQGGAHEKTVEAAEFLVNHAASASASASASGGEEYASLGTRALLEFAPDHRGWRFMLPRLHTVSRFGQDRGAAAEAVFEVLASEAQDPVLRAAGRYYVAAGRMQAANAGGLPEEERAAERQGALDAASGLSAGVEGELLLGGGLTLAEAEADLIRGIRHGTVGSKVPDLVGSRLDGVEERLSDYEGRVVLLDFWATWCVPCVAALPQKRQLVADLPADRFALLSISVDAELETVTGFQEDEPMPWSNWHVGMMSDVTRTLNVNSFPTYILLDEQGAILARSQHLPEDFVSLIEATAEGAAQSISDAIAEDYRTELKALFEHFHRNPELSFLEHKTAARLAEELRKSGVEVTEGIGRTGIVGMMANGEGPLVLVRADMDGLPVEEKSELSYSSTVRQVDLSGEEVPVMHACGHDMHITTMVGVARRLAAMRDRWSGTVMFVGQPAEERIMGAREMIEDGLYERFGVPDYALALHVSAGRPAGKIEVPPGLLASSSDSVDITVFGVGAHGASPHRGKDPIYIAAQLVVALQGIVSRELNPLDPGVVTVGAIHGGFKHNVIPDRVELQLTVRANREETREQLLSAIDRIAEGVGRAAGLPASLLPKVVRTKESTPVTMNDPELAARVRTAVAAGMGEDVFFTAPPSGMGAEDFAYFLRTEHKVPGTYFNVGGTDPADLEAEAAGGPRVAGHHSPFFRIEPEPSIRAGVEAMTLAVLDLLRP